MNFKCKFGFHDIKHNRKAIPDVLRSAYPGGKEFGECPCGKKTVVITIGDLVSPRDLLLESILEEDAERSAKAKSEEKKVIRRKRKTSSTPASDQKTRLSSGKK